MNICLKAVIDLIRTITPLSVKHYGYKASFDPRTTIMRFEGKEKIEIGDIFARDANDQTTELLVKGITVKIDVKAEKVGNEDTDYPQAAITLLGRSLLECLKNGLTDEYAIGLNVYNGTIKIDIKFPEFSVQASAIGP